MAQKKKKAAAPAKATQTSEPQVQVLTRWQGISAENNPLDWHPHSDANDQTDLEPEHFLIQNNLETCSNGTVETREPMKAISTAPLIFDGSQYRFKGFAYLCKRTLYAIITPDAPPQDTGKDRIVYRSIDADPASPWLELPENDLEAPSVQIDWNSIFHYGQRLICLGESELPGGGRIGEFWASDTLDSSGVARGYGGAAEVHNWRRISDPQTPGQRLYLGGFRGDDDDPAGMAWSDWYESVETGAGIGPIRPTLIAMGKLKINNVYAKDGQSGKANPRYVSVKNAACRIKVVMTYVNEVGQTLGSYAAVTYTDTTPAEWGSARWLRVTAPSWSDQWLSGYNWQKQQLLDDPFMDGEDIGLRIAVPPYDATGVDLYVSMNDSLDYIFIGHVSFGTAPLFGRNPREVHDITINPDGSVTYPGPPTDMNNDELLASINRYNWRFDWYGGEADTSVWTHSPLDLPKENTTKGAPASYGIERDGRMYFWGDPNQPDRLYIGGNPGNELSISRGLGGGFIDHGGPAHGDVLKSVQRFETYNGATIMTALFDNKNTGQTSRANVVDTNIQFTNEIASRAWMFEDVEGVAGCNSFHGAGVFYDGMYYTTRDGLGLTTKAMESQNQQRTDYVSDIISPYFIDRLAQHQHLTWVVCIKDIIYLCFGERDLDDGLDPIVFCYDIKQKVWYTYTVDGSADRNLWPRGLFHVDWEGMAEGLGVVTRYGIQLMPLTMETPDSAGGSVPSMLVTAELSRYVPLSQMTYVNQLEFRFNTFIGKMTILLEGVDYYGREITVRKEIDHSVCQYNLAEYMRVDCLLESYKLIINADARYRLTHILVKQYSQSAQVGQVWGFDDEIKKAHGNLVHHYLPSYNNLKKTLIP